MIWQELKNPSPTSQNLLPTNSKYCMFKKVNCYQYDMYYAHTIPIYIIIFKCIFFIGDSINFSYFVINYYLYTYCCNVNFFYSNSIPHIISTMYKIPKLDLNDFLLTFELFILNDLISTWWYRLVFTYFLKLYVNFGRYCRRWGDI